MKLRSGLSLLLLASGCSSDSEKTDARAENTPPASSNVAQPTQTDPPKVGSADPVDPTDSVGPVDPADSVGPVDPADPVVPAEAEPEPLPPLQGPLPLAEIAGLGPAPSNEAIMARFGQYDDPPRDDGTFGYRPVHGSDYETPSVEVEFHKGALIRFEASYRPNHPPSEFGLSGPWIDLLGKDADTIAAVLGQPARANGREVQPGETPLTNKALFPNRHIMWVFEDVKRRDGSSTTMSAELYFERFKKKVVASNLEVRWFPPASAAPPKPSLSKVKIPAPKAPPGLSPSDYRGVALAKAKSSTKSIDRASGGVGVSVSYPSFTFSDQARTRSARDHLEKQLVKEARTLDGTGESGMFEYSCEARLAAEFLVSFTCSGVDGRMLDKDLANGTGGGGALEVWSKTLIVAPGNAGKLEVFDIVSAFKDKSLQDLMWIAAAITAKQEELNASEVERAIDEVGRTPFDDGTALAFFDEDGLAVHLCPDGDLDDCLELVLPWKYADALAAKDGPVAALRAVYE